MIESEINIEVRYYETDLMGIVHHSNYIRYFECGRNKLLQDIGLPITEVEKAGIMMPVVSVNCKYRVPSKMGDTLRVVSKINKLPLVKVIVETQIFNQMNELVCDGEVILGFIHSDTRKPTRAPQLFLNIVNKFF